MARIRNPRVLALESMKRIRDGLAAARNLFEVSSRVYEDVVKTYTDERTGTERTYTDCVPRQRQAHEYPENQSQAWIRLFHAADAAAKEALELREMARENYLRLQRESNGTN